MNKLALFVSLALFFCTPAVAACNYPQRSFEELYQQAPNVFIGHVIRVNKQQVAFAVDKRIKGRSYMKTFTAKRGQSSCHVDFRMGTYWLYMGDYIYQGTMQLFDENGRPIESAAKIVKEKLAIDIYDSKPTVFEAIAVNACGPTDGAAFYIRLKNGLTAQVDASLDAYEGRESVVEFKTVRGKAGGVTIYSCDPDGKNCGPRLNGALAITEADKSTVKGYMEVVDTATGSKQRFIFEAQRLPDETLCP